jgi:tetratricopeptide (TPR) repeat protein
MNLMEMKATIEELRKMGLKKERIRSQLEKEVKLHPEDGNLYIKLGLYYLAVDDVRESLRNLKIAALLKPSNEHIWFIQGYIYENSKLYNQALQAYYFSYRLGSVVARDKMLTFCNSAWAKTLQPKQKKMIDQFKESVC